MNWSALPHVFLVDESSTSCDNPIITKNAESVQATPHLIFVIPLAHLGIDYFFGCETGPLQSAKAESSLMRRFNTLRDRTIESKMSLAAASGFDEVGVGIDEDRLLVGDGDERSRQAGNLFHVLGDGVVDRDARRVARL